MERIWLESAQAQFTQMQKARRYLHQNAEVGFDLQGTMEYIKAELERLGYQPKPIGRCALIAEIGQGKEYFLLRADADALPLQERSGESFACKYGNMHACGHDLHTAMLLGAAAILKKREAKLHRRVRLLFQPAEEVLEGAKACVEAGVLNGVAKAMMLHVLPALPFPAGTAIIPQSGIGAPAADFFQVTVAGKGCHGSSPWQGVDALLIGAQAVCTLQTLAARELSPAVPATLTFGEFHAGNAGNAIASKAELSGTLRAMDEEVRAFLKARLEKVVKSVAVGMRGRARIQYDGGCPCLKNDERMCAFLLKTARQSLGEGFTVDASFLPKGGVGGSEDFAYIAKEVPSVMVGICAGDGRRGYDQPLHSPKVRFNEECMPYGAALLAAAAEKNE